MDKHLISKMFLEAQSREDLSNRVAAAYLNINPCYISMLKNPAHWDFMGSKIWNRLEEWVNTREPISSFSIPEGEEIYIPKEKTPPAERKIKASKEKKVKKQEDEKQAEAKNQMAEFLDDVTSNDFLPAQTRKNKKPKKASTNSFHIPLDPARFKVALDIEINLVINGQRVQISR